VSEGEKSNRQSRTKVALAVGLTVVFIVVIVVQVRTYSGDAGVPSGIGAQEQTARPDVADTSARPRPNPASLDTPERAAPWPKVELADCTRHDPFATPDGFIPKQEDLTEKTDSDEARQLEAEMAQKRAAQERAISELMEAGVNAILKGPDHSTAILGTYSLQVGQEIHGHRVVAIEPHGIVLEPITPLPATPDP